MASGRDLLLWQAVEQVRRLVTAGAKYVVVVGPYNLARTPWSTAIGQGDLLLEATSRFNEDMLVNLADLGSNVLYVDAAFHFNLMTSSPSSYNLTDATSVMCTSADGGPARLLPAETRRYADPHLYREALQALARLA